MKKHLRYEIKRLLSSQIANFIWMAAVIWISFTTMSISNTVFPGGYTSFSATSGLLQILIAVTCSCFFLPFAVFDYRYKKNRADTFLQLPLKEGELKRTRLLLCLIMFLIAFTVVYWVGIGIIGIRIATFVASGNQVLMNYNFLGYLYVYLFLLLFLTAEYFINSYLIQLGNNSSDSALYCLFGQLILGFALVAPLLYASTYFGVEYESYYFPFTNSYSVISPAVYLYIGFNKFILGYNLNPFEYGSWIPSEWISFFMPMVLGAVAAILLFIQKDPSGEHFGRNGERHPAIKVLPHGMALVLGILSLSGGLSLLLMVLWGLGYYFVLAYLNRGFKIKKNDLIIMISCIALVILLYIIGIIASSIRTGDLQFNLIQVLNLIP